MNHHHHHSPKLSPTTTTPTPPPLSNVLPSSPSTPPPPPLSCATPLYCFQFVYRTVLHHWFMIGVILSITLAYFFPDLGKNGGPIRAEYTIKYGAVMVVFLLSGLSLNSTLFKQAFAHWKAHLIIQVTNFLFVSALGFGLSKLLLLCFANNFNDALAAGFVVAVSMPTTISSNVIMTEAANGNEPLSLINATFGNILGIFISPLLLLLYLGARTTINFGSILIDIPITVIGPLIFGQFLRFFKPTWVTWLNKRLNFSIISSCMLLLLIYASFADNFSKRTLHVSMDSLFIMIISIWLFYPFIMLICFIIGISLKFPRPDIVSIVFCGSTKTLSLGIPLIGIIYRNDPNIGLYSLPLLIYHASQLLLGGWVVGPLSNWVLASNSNSNSISSSTSIDSDSNSNLLPVSVIDESCSPHPNFNFGVSVPVSNISST